MKMITSALAFAILLAGCMIPGTYYDPSDRYIMGMRFFDRHMPKEAREIWEPMAKSGDCDAQYRMGLLYFMGEGVPQSCEIAYDWWLRAANQGHAFAQGLLAVMYAHDTVPVGTFVRKVVIDCGKGCCLEKNPSEAYRWIKLAQIYSVYPDQKRSLAKFAEKYRSMLGADQAEKVDQELKGWKPTPTQCKPRKIL